MCIRDRATAIPLALDNGEFTFFDSKKTHFGNNPEDLIYMNIAIITGASSGLGREFALQLCHNYAAEIDEIWLLARRKEPLLTLAQEISATGICVGAAMPMDLSLIHI